MWTLAKFSCLQLLLGLAACGGDGPTAADQSRLVGRYLLISVDGQNVPVVLQESGPRIVLRSSSLDFVSSEDVDISFTFDIDGVADVIEDQSGYRRSGSQLTIFIVSGSDTTSVPGVVSGNDVTILAREDLSDPSSRTIPWLYRKG